MFERFAHYVQLHEVMEHTGDSVCGGDGGKGREQIRHSAQAEQDSAYKPIADCLYDLHTKDNQDPVLIPCSVPGNRPHCGQVNRANLVPKIRYNEDRCIIMKGTVSKPS